MMAEVLGEWKHKREREPRAAGPVGQKMTYVPVSTVGEGEEEEKRKRWRGIGKCDRTEKASVILKPELSAWETTQD